jgi:CRP-like cAMP-binding protein
MYDQLQKIVPPEKIDELLALCRERSIGVSDHFIQAGEVPDKIAYVLSGLFRYVYINHKGDEFTKGIIPENAFLSSYSAMIKGTPSYFAIEALEQSEILEISWDAFSKLLEKDLFWIKFMLKFLEKGFITKEKRERDLLLLDAETRYKQFLSEYPGMEQRIKQGIIASYLGIKPETLSRIRRKGVF